MSFPVVEHKKFRQVPIAKVICQLRFPPILSIESKQPAEFQEYIRDEFPNYRSQTNQEIIQIGNNAFPMVQPQIGFSVEHEFSSANGKTIISLAKTFISFTTSEYQGWDKLISIISKGIKALQSCYRPAFYTRIGLRYINQFNARTVDGNCDWNLLFKPMIIGYLGSDMGNYILAVTNVSEFNFKDNGARITFSKNGVQNNSICTLDGDYFSKNPQIDSDTEKVTTLIKNLHTQAFYSFMFAITPEMERRLGEI